MHDSLGTHNEPQYSTSGVPADAADLTEVAAFAAKLGNLRIGTTTDRNNASGADLWRGLLWLDTTTGRLYVYLSNVWVPLAGPGAPYAMAAGAGSNNGSSPTTVTFPAGRFSAPPIVAMTNSGASVSFTNAQSVTATSAVMGGYDDLGNSAPGSWTWIAVQMTPTTGAG